jgi:Glycosyl transferases group 1
MSAEGSRRIRVAAAVPGKPGKRPASAHIRVLRRLEHPIVRRVVEADVVDKASSLLKTDADLVLVQRTALQPELVEPLITRLRNRRIPLVIEVDDNLFLKDRADPEYGPYLESLARLVDAASLVTVSTDALRTALSDRAKTVVVVPNALDEQLWLPPAEREPGSGTRLLFVGTRTHAEDLALLRPVLERLRQERSLNVSLFVIGGEREGDGQEWYSRLVVPRDAREYPAFVRWMKGQVLRFDIGVAPLVENEFNQSKSDLKFLDYSGLGLAGVYSDVPAFSSCIDGITGLKTANTVDGWCEALARLCTHGRLRAQLGKSAQEYLHRERLLIDSAAEYAGLLVDAVCSLRSNRLRRTLSGWARDRPVRRSTRRSKPRSG